MKSLLRKSWRPLLVLLLLFIIWEILVNLFHVPKWLLPSPSDIFQEATLNGTVLINHLMSTLELSIIRLFHWYLYRIDHGHPITFASILKRCTLSIAHSFAKYSNHCTCSIISHLVWIWNVTKDYCHYFSLLFPCDGSSIRWI